MSRIRHVARKLIVAAIGIPLLVVGIILIPLPGPGLLICFAAFFILSLEFDWAKGYLEKIKSKFKEIFDVAKQRADSIEKKNKPDE